MLERQHLTTRRGFVIAMGFGGVSLYGLWAGYGAAPGPQALLGGAIDHDEIEITPPADPMAAMDHASTGAGTASEAFRRDLNAFIERYQVEDGSVYPRPLVTEVAAAPTEPPNGAAMANNMQGMATIPQTHDMTGMPGMSDEVTKDTLDSAHHPDANAAIDVYLLAERWYYEPSQLRLNAGQRYQFKMMAADVSHGASMQFGSGSRMIRLRPNITTELEVVFDRPGSYLIYCTVYCGQAHDQMQARIEVV